MSNIIIDILRCEKSFARRTRLSSFSGNSCKIRERLKTTFWDVLFSDININQGTEEQTHHLPSSVNDRILWYQNSE